MNSPIGFPSVVGSAEDLELTSAVHWLDCELVPGRDYRIRAMVTGGDTTVENAALVCFDTATPGNGLSQSANVGAFMYLNAGPGDHQTDRFFTVGARTGRIGVMAWGARGPVRLRILAIEEAKQFKGQTSFFFSFDVEASPDRSDGDAIDTLVWGRLGGQEVGIRRICGVLEQYGITGNFLVDFASCLSRGDRRAREIVDFLLGRGHEVHVHLHPAWLARDWGLRIGNGRSSNLDRTGYEMSRRLLDFAVAKYEQFTGERARMFRSGSYQMNSFMVLAAGSLGIEALSNVRAGRLKSTLAGWEAAASLEPFRWENGVLEIPVDASSPEAGTWDTYHRRFENALRRKTFESTFNLVMHSWSLIRRNENRIHDTYDPELEQRLHELCAHAAENGKAIGYNRYMDTTKPLRPMVTFDRIQQPAETSDSVYVFSSDVTTCVVCGAIYSRQRCDDCASCAAGAPHRRLRNIMDNYGNFFMGRHVVAHGLTHTQRRALFGATCSVVTVDGAEDMKTLASGSQHCVVWFGTEPIAADPTAIDGAARVLAPDGVLICIEQETAPELVARFEVSVVPAYDPLDERYAGVCFARPRPADAAPTIAEPGASAADASLAG